MNGPRALEATDRRLASALFALAAALLLLVGNWVPEDVDTEVGFQATRALATRGALHLAPDTPSAERILTHLPDGENAYNCRGDAQGRQFPYWGLAYVAAGVPLYWLGHGLDVAMPSVGEEFARQTFTSVGLAGSDYFARAAVMALQALCGAGTILCIFLAARRLGASATASLAAALVAGFATNLGVQARSGLSDAQAAFLVALAIERAVAVAATGSLRVAAVAGIAAGLAFTTKLHTAFALVPLPFLLLTGLDRRRRAAAFALLVAGALPFVVLFLAANAIRWGDPLITGYEKSTSHSWFRIPVHRGLAALLFAPGKGVVVHALPVAALGVVGLLALARARRAGLAAALAASAVGALLLPASTIEWHGAWSFGPRYALLAYPALAVASAFAIDALAGRLRWVTAALALAGLATVLPGFLGSPFAALAVSMEGARVQWPDAGFPAGHPPEARDADRFLSVCFETGPLNPLRVQHALARAALAGRDGLRYREDLGLDRDGVALPPEPPEYRGSGSIGWWGAWKRLRRSVFFVVPALLAAVAAAAAWRMRAILAARPRGDDPGGSPAP